MALYTDIAEVRLRTGLTESQVCDEDLQQLIEDAQKEVSMKLQTKVIREPVLYIDAVRENDIDASNTTYYVANWRGHWIADRNLDNSIDTSDIIVYQVDSDDVETTLTVSSITSADGKFVLSSAPASSVDLFVTYSYIGYDPETPDPMLSNPVIYLTGAYGYKSLAENNSGIKSAKFGNTTIGYNDKNDNSAKYYELYQSAINDLLQQDLGEAMFGESEVPFPHRSDFY